jgi:hypothetical protein
MLVLSSVRDMSLKRLSMSGKKSSLGKTSSSWASVMKNSPVVAQSAPQKPYRLSPIQDHKRRGSEGVVPARGARRKTGWERLWGSAKLWRQEAVVAVCCVFAERSDLSFIATEGGEQAAREAKRTANQTVSYSFSTQANRFSFHVTVQFCSPVMRDKKKGSAPRHIPQTAACARIMAWRGEARRGEARRAAEEEERAWESLLLTHSYHKGEISPYMLVQLLLN